MAAKQVKMHLPSTELSKTDTVEFEVFTKGELYGKVKISKDHFEWYSVMADENYPMPWKTLDLMLNQIWGRKRTVTTDTAADNLKDDADHVNGADVAMQAPEP